MHERYINPKNIDLKLGALESDGELLIPLSAVRAAIAAAPSEDVVQRAEFNNLWYKLTGMMHSVDKWLDGEELNQDEVKRAITMREKTLHIVEGLQAEVEKLKEDYLLFEETSGLRKAKAEVAREIFAEIEDLFFDQYLLGNITASLFDDKYSELKKKYTEGGDTD